MYVYTYILIYISKFLEREGPVSFPLGVPWEGEADLSFCENNIKY